MPTARTGTHLPLILASLLALALTGCGGGGGSSSGNTTLTGPDPTTLSLSGTTPDGLTVTLAQDKSTVSTNSTMNYTLTLTNTSATPVSIQTANQVGANTPLVPASVTILNSSGASVYTLPAPAQTITVTLQPNDYLTQTITLTNILQNVDRYQATATFQTGLPATSLGPLVITAR